MSKGGYQKKRLEEKKMRAKRARQRARRRKLIITWFATLAVLGLLGWVLAMVFTGDESDFATDDPTPTPAPTEAPLPAGCTEAEPDFDKPTFDAPPEMQIDPEQTYTAAIVTNCGTMTLNLFAADAPETVNNFVFLAREGFYDGVLFHRVIKDFMIQGGDPQGTGAGGPGYQFEDENLAEFDRPHLLAMANSGPDTNGSQFFITEVPTPHLNGRHSIFGELLEGQDVFDTIIGIQTGDQDRPLANMVILTIEITEA